MSASIEFVKSLYAAFARGEIATLVKACAPDIRWEVKGRPQDYPCIGIWTGQSGVGAFFQVVAETETPLAFAQSEFHAAGDNVFVTGRYKWTLTKTGKTVECDYLHIFTIKAGKVTQFREFTDTAQFALAWKG